MAVPDYQSFLLPILKLAADEKEHSSGQALETIPTQFNLSEEDKNQLLPSGRQRTIDNRISWAITYLKKAGLLQSINRGTFKITERGLEVLRRNPPSLNKNFLMQYQEFREFQNIDQGDERVAPAPESSVETPEEILENSYNSLQAQLAKDLLDKVKASPPKFFENLVLDLLLAMGYGGSRKDAAEAVGKAGDEGIDGIIKEDRLGLDAIYVQAKRWDGVVGRPLVQGFAGSLDVHRSNKGILITTSGFTADAKSFAERVNKKTIILIDGQRLTELMIEHNIGVAEIHKYSIKRVDNDYFDEQ